MNHRPVMAGLAADVGLGWKRIKTVFAKKARREKFTQITISNALLPSF